MLLAPPLTDADARTFRPLLAGIQVPQGLDVTIDDIFVYIFTGGEPSGAYAFFALLTSPGAFQDGRIDASDIIEITIQLLVFNP